MDAFLVSPNFVAKNGFVATEFTFQVFDVDLAVARNDVVGVDEIRLHVTVVRGFPFAVVWDFDVAELLSGFFWWRRLISRGFGLCWFFSWFFRFCWSL